MRSRSSSITLTLVLVAFGLPACHAGPRPNVFPVPASHRAVPQLQRDINVMLGVPALGRGYWGVLVKSLKTDETLYTLNAQRLMMPASTMKIVTLAAAVEQLGWDFRYDTRIVGGGGIEAGVLDGDLLVVGSGDPTIVDRDGMATQLFGEWAEQLRAAGIHAISGRIIGDDNAFDDEALGAGWSWDDLADGFAAGVGALQYNENTVRIAIAPGEAVGAPAAVTVAPEGSGLVINNLLKTTEAQHTASVVARRRPGSSRLELRGSVPLGGASSARTVAVDNPTLFFVTALRNALIAHGIAVRGPAVDIDDVTDAPSRNGGIALVTYRSPPLAALATRLMKLSQNLYAETLLKTIGAAAGTPTSETGRATIRATLQGWGVQPTELIQADGSGLSRYSYVTADALVKILTHVGYDDTLRELFEALLPIAGRDGTLSERMKGTPAEGNARAKTGAMSNVRALAGFVTTADGEPVVFAILANNFETPPDAITRTIDAMVVRLAQFSRR